jgi:hypothetical protein
VSQGAFADGKAEKKDFSKYKRIDTSQFVTVSRHPSSEPFSKFQFVISQCVDKEGNIIPSSDLRYVDCSENKFLRN